MQDSTDLKSTVPHIQFNQSNGILDETIENLMIMTGSIRRPGLVRSMILTALKAGMEDSEGVDLKIMNTTLKEMRYAAKVFSSYPNKRKVTVFGSARTKTHQPEYELAREFGERLSQSGYMVITGGGGGIMQAINEGAGSDSSFGVNIRLPWEEGPNTTVKGNSKSINYKYFFNRKLAFLKEAHAIAVFPGGFGTHDELMETLTLLQTGKLPPLPLLLLDKPDGSYWTQWMTFVKEVLLAEGYISDTDLSFFKLAHTSTEAVDHIARFYKNYHSLRYVNKRLVLRLNSALDPSHIQSLQSDFKDILLPGGSICASKALPEEINEADLLDLPRLLIDFDLKHFSRLRMLIDAINAREAPGQQPFSTSLH